MEHHDSFHYDHADVEASQAKDRYPVKTDMGVHARSSSHLASPTSPPRLS